MPTHTTVSPLKGCAAVLPGMGTPAHIRSVELNELAGGHDPVQDRFGDDRAAQRLLPVFGGELSCQDRGAADLPCSADIEQCAVRVRRDRNCREVFQDHHQPINMIPPRLSSHPEEPARYGCQL